MQIRGMRGILPEFICQKRFSKTGEAAKLVKFFKKPDQILIH